MLLNVSDNSLYVILTVECFLKSFDAFIEQSNNLKFNLSPIRYNKCSGYLFFWTRGKPKITCFFELFSNSHLGLRKI